MLRHVTELDRCASSDTEAGYVHSVAPDPRRLDPVDNTRIQEEGCLAITDQKKYYEFMNAKGSVFIKRSLTPSEYLVTLAGNLILPYMCMERMKNEVAAIRYIQSNTTIPTPNIRCAFEDHGRYYIITDMVPGVPLVELPEDKKALVIKELEGYIAQMHTIKLNFMGSFLGDVILPYRVSKTMPHDVVFKCCEASTQEFVLCHNDVSQYNVMVDETTLKINAILDWEYAGYYPPEFDGAFYLRSGPSIALEGEEDDVPKLLEALERWRA
ncbi:kinase-like domain-containing protein [Lyophyllum atratum]|nr:kinase-like domain-containing protein [Lyophyllum atratum]